MKLRKECANKMMVRFQSSYWSRCVRRRWLAGAVVVLGAVLVAGCGGNGGPITIGPAGVQTGTTSGSTFVGSTACQPCHQMAYLDEAQMGHPYKLNPVVSGQPPTYPSHVPDWTPNVTPPVPGGWANVAYVIGGYGWKARFIDQNGYIYTGDKVQYNLHAVSAGVPAQEWVAYHSSDAPGTKPYDCGPCHMTGWDGCDLWKQGADPSQHQSHAASQHQGGLIGIHGKWSEPGIRCEACHGPGSKHVQTQSRSDIDLGSGIETCAKCHNRGNTLWDINNLPPKLDSPAIEVSGGFDRHHEQWEELINGGHATLNCIDCHDPHKGPHYEGAQPDALVRQCYDCHQVRSNKHPSGQGTPTCVDCHMPRATKSGIKVSEYKGDVHTHIFSINTAAVDKTAGMFTADGKTVATPAKVTLDFACYGCHKSPGGENAADPNATAPTKTLAELAAMAAGIHQ